MRKLKTPPPVTTWARGDTVPLRWFRNNHEGGFVRWSLVPAARSGDQAAHDAAAFAYGCYTVNRYKCTPEEEVRHCGGDNTGSGARYEARVPTNVPDGEYVLGWTWYGGYNKPDIGTFEKLILCVSRDGGWRGTAAAGWFWVRGRVGWRVCAACSPAARPAGHGAFRVVRMAALTPQPPPAAVFCLSLVVASRRPRPARRVHGLCRLRARAH